MEMWQRELLDQASQSLREEIEFQEKTGLPPGIYLEKSLNLIHEALNGCEYCIRADCPNRLDINSGPCKVFDMDA